MRRILSPKGQVAGGCIVSVRTLLVAMPWKENGFIHALVWQITGPRREWFAGFPAGRGITCISTAMKRCRNKERN
jgi:hypothetical protein